MANEDIKNNEDSQKPDSKSEAVASAEKKPEVKDTEDNSKELAAEKAAAKKKKRKIRRQILRGQAHIQCTYNNTIVNVSDAQGRTVAWSSAGSLGFKGAKKATPFAATQIVKSVIDKIQKFGMQEVEVYLKGVGSGREAAVRALANNNLDIVMIKDLTPIPHNGCRPKKPRRV
ncbi:MAG: 30S ribosomal protein S11 [Parcubacteria group bacterium]|jgi:small subunit ribosomal protein S11